MSGPLMRVGILSYPTLFQSPGGIRMKIGRTITALNRRGIEASLIDTARERFTDYDLIHLFAAFNGNYRIVQQAKSDELPVVVSTILSPPFSKWEGLRARVLDRIVGRLTRWEVTTSYRQIRIGLELADQLVTMGEIERRLVIDAYGIDPGKVNIVPNGIGDEFFHSDPAPFLQAYKPPRPFVLNVGTIGDVKNQLGLVRALKGTGIDIVLIGYAGQAGAEYLDACKREGGEHLHYLGELSHGPMLASAYAAAALIAMPSRYEGMPNSILEALACDRQVIMTRQHTMDMELPVDVISQVDANDHAGIRSAVLRHLKQQVQPGRARSVVEEMSWDVVAAKLEAIYRRAAPKWRAAAQA